MFALTLALVAGVGAAYGVRAGRVQVPRWKVGLFGLGLLLLAVALSPPFADAAHDRFSAHMAQHLLIGDLAPLALLAGLSGPLLRPVLRFVYPLRVLTHPAVALPLWVANLLVWHLAFLYEGALDHEWVHVVEHVSFFTTGVLMWAPVLETLPAPVWFGSGAKLAYVVVVRLVGTVLGNVFMWADAPLYEQYGDRGDQALAGAIMTVEGSLVTFTAIAWLFLRMAAEGELRQELLERGLDPRAVKRAVRFGRAEELS